jgi:hypothetical protein
MLYFGGDHLWCPECESMDSYEERVTTKMQDYELDITEPIYERRHGTKSTYYKRNDYLKTVLDDIAKKNNTEFDSDKVKMVCAVFNDIMQNKNVLDSEPEYNQKKNLMSYKLVAKLISDKLGYTSISQYIQETTNKKKLTRYTKWFNMLYEATYDD